MKTIIAITLLCATTAGAQISTSASYSLLHGEPGEGGGPVQNSGGTIVAGLGMAGSKSGGTSNLTTAGTHTIGNFIGQLYDPKALSVAASPSTVNETGNTQLSANAVMDDDTTLVIPATDLTWSIENGYITNITPGGLLTVGNVFANDVAQASGLWMGFTGFTTINILNTGNDDFLSYAGDGLDDAWQFGFFGIENPDAAAGQDPDGDKQDNFFENLAGYDPTDRTSFFSIDLSLASGSILELKLSKVIPGTRYLLQWSNDPTAGWTEFDVLTPAIEELDKIVNPESSGDPVRLYRVELEAQ